MHTFKDLDQLTNWFGSEQDSGMKCYQLVIDSVSVNLQLYFKRV